jgi:hypothetical protein
LAAGACGCGRRAAQRVRVSLARFADARALLQVHALPARRGASRVGRRLAARALPRARQRRLVAGAAPAARLHLSEGDAARAGHRALRRPRLPQPARRRAAPQHRLRGPSGRLLRTLR